MGKSFPRDLLVRDPDHVALQFTPFRTEHFAAVRDFNERMRAGNADTAFLLPVEPRETSADGPIQLQQFIALDGAGVHGGVIEMDQPGWLEGRAIRALNYQSPLSEGILDRRYGMVAVRMVKFMEARGDSVFFVGMGAAENPMPRMLKASGWSMRPVPFLFRVHRARSFLREMRMFNTTPVTQDRGARRGVQRSQHRSAWHARRCGDPDRNSKCAENARGEIGLRKSGS